MDLCGVAPGAEAIQARDLGALDFRVKRKGGNRLFLIGNESIDADNDLLPPPGGPLLLLASPAALVTPGTSLVWTERVAARSCRSQDPAWRGKLPQMSQPSSAVCL